MAKRGMSVKQAAADLGVSPKWIRKQIAAGTVAPERVGSKRNGRFALTDVDIKTLRAKATEKTQAEETIKGDATALARISRLESDRANLLAQVAWSRAIAQEQQKTLELERERVERLMADLETQRARVEALKALTVIDRALGRQKAI